MPIEIKELVIRATIDSKGDSKSDQQNTAKQVDAKEDVVAECVEQVLEILRQQQER